MKKKRVEYHIIINDVLLFICMTINEVIKILTHDTMHGEDSIIY